jgi:hypothetical protein
MNQNGSVLPRRRSFITSSLESDSPPVSPWFHLEGDLASDLVFSVGCAAAPVNPIARAHPRGFVAGLWQHDVGELFLKHAECERYLEINLAPHGAWWSCLFQAYREPLAESKVESLVPVRLEAVTTADTWETSLTISRAFLEEALGFGPRSRANVCFILGPPADRHHFSWASLPHDPPDFHRVADFVPIC